MGEDKYKVVTTLGGLVGRRVTRVAHKNADAAIYLDDDHVIFLNAAHCYDDTELEVEDDPLKNYYPYQLRDLGYYTDLEYEAAEEARERDVRREEQDRRRRQYESLKIEFEGGD